MDNQELISLVNELQRSNFELIERCNMLGKQITQMKEMYQTILAEVRILKEGGNL